MHSYVVKILFLKNCGCYRNQVVTALVWYVISHWLGEVWIPIRDSFICFTFIFVPFGESCLLISWCAGGRCGMMCNNEDRGRSRRPGADDRRSSHRSDNRWLGDREVGWHCVRSAPCIWRWEAWISWLSLKTKVDGLWVVWPQNHSAGFLRFGLKTDGSGFLIWVSKPVATVWWFGSQNYHNGFLVWASKPSGL
jgi:hypothetical protein